MHLVKTAIDFKISASSRDYILLGSWCHKGSKNISKDLKQYKLVPYHWDDRKKFTDDYFYLSNLYEEKLTQFTDALNKRHNLNKSREYWRIIIGPWLRFCMDALFDRYECVKAAKNLKTVTSCKLGSYNLHEWCPIDFSTFWIDLTSDEWNEVIFSECIKYLNLPHTENSEFQIVAKRSIQGQNTSRTNVKKGLKKLVAKYSAFRCAQKKA